MKRQRLMIAAATAAVLGVYAGEQAKTEQAAPPDPVVQAFVKERKGKLPTEGMEYIPIGLIRTNPIALRDVDREGQSFIELKDSVRAEGIVNPINVRHKPGDDGKAYELIDGLQRFTSAQEVGSGVVKDGKQIPGVVPALILNRSDDEALVTQIIGNAQRVETKPAEYAKGLKRILGTNPTWTIASLAGMLHKSPAWLSKQLSLNKLSDAAKLLVNDNKITAANAYVLAGLPQDEQSNWLERAQNEEAGAFGAAVAERAKQIRDANRQGREVGEEKFVPVGHLRKKTEIEEVLGKPDMARQLVAEEGAKTAADGFLFGLNWSLHLDKKGLADQEAKFNERKKQNEEQKIRRDAERKDKRAKELAEKQEQAKKDAEEARKKAAALPPDPIPV